MLFGTKRGYDDKSFNIIYKPLILDAFCSVVNLLMKKKFLVILNQKLTLLTLKQKQLFIIPKIILFQKDLSEYDRWYGSVTILPNGEILMVGGKVRSNKISTIPEILIEKNGKLAWKELKNAESNYFLERII